MKEQIKQLCDLVTAMKTDQTAILTRLVQIDSCIEAVKADNRGNSATIVELAYSIPCSCFARGYWLVLVGCHNHPPVSAVVLSNCI